MTKWHQLSTKQQNFFRKHLSTGCGPDDWEEGSDLLKELLDSWWRTGACDEHDWEGFCGYYDKWDYHFSNLKFLWNAIWVNPKLILQAYAAYKIIEKLHTPRFTRIKYTVRELDLCIGEFARRERNGIDQLQTIDQWMDFLFYER